MGPLEASALLEFRLFWPSSCRSTARLIQEGSFLACVGYCQVCGGAPGAFTHFPSLVVMPVSPMFRNLWPSLSRSLVPSLALTWSSPCRISRWACMLPCFFALFVPFAFLSTELCLWLRVGTASSSLRAATRAPCLRMRSHFYCTRSFMGLRRPVLSGFGPCP